MSDDRIYEYIVVGTGLSGAQAVETLLDAGREVLLLDVSYRNESNVKFPDEDFISIRTSRTDQQQLWLGENYEGIPWDKIKTGAQLTPGRKYITKGLERWIGLTSDSFFPYETLSYGGLGNAWGAGCYMFSDKEFQKIGIDRQLFLRSYQKVADRVGITRPDADGEAYSLQGLTGLLPSVKPEKSIQNVYDKYQANRQKLNEKGFYASTPSVAITTVDKEDRKAFQYEDMEFWHDNAKSVYRPWIAFDKLLKHSNISSVFRKLVVSFMEKEDHTEVICTDVDTNEQHTYRCKKLLLCSGVLGTARIVLRSIDKKARLPLLCNPYAYVPMINWSRLGKVPEQRKNGMGQLVLYYDRLKDNSDVSMAALFTFRSLLLFRLVKETPLNFADGRLLQQYLMPAIVIAGIHHSEQYGDQKYVEMRDDAGSPTGDRLYAEYMPTKAEEKAVKDKEAAYFKVLRGLGCIPISRLNPGNGASIHYAGTLPFSDTEKPLTTAMDGRLYGTRSVYIADGSSFRFLPAKGISFTLMANAERVASNSLGQNELVGDNTNQGAASNSLGQNELVGRDANQGQNELVGDNTNQRGMANAERVASNSLGQNELVGENTNQGANADQGRDGFMKTQNIASLRTEEKKMKIAITGATGFVGGELVRYFTAAGHEVIKLQRRSVIASDERFYDVRSADSIPDLTGVDAVIHAAFLKYDKKNLPDSSEFNISGALALEKACHQAGAKFVFLSTMSAHSEAISHYGKHKYDIEQQLDKKSDLIFKLGLVVGRKGLFDTIKTAISKGAFIPLVGSGSQPIQTIAVTDVCRIIEHSLQKGMTGIYCIGTEKVYTLRDLYGAIAARLGKMPVFVSVPYGVVSLALSTIETLRIPFNVSQENLLGLKQLKAFDTKGDLDKLGVTIMDMDETLDKLFTA